MERKQMIIECLRAFAAQTPGMEPGNYGDWKAYRAESRSVTRDLHDARELIRSVELRDSITADDLLAAARGAFSGRLTIEERADGKIGIDYCTGQYFATEYRKAVCAVCSAALWERKRNDMPAPQYKVNGSGAFATREDAAQKAAEYLPAIVAIEERYQGKTAGDWIRSSFRREYGARLASRYFD